MKHMFRKVVERLLGAKVHADHTRIKGTYSGGQRDGSGKDWRKV